MKERVIRLLQICGPVSNKMLASMLGVTERKVRQLIQELRTANYPIGYEYNGYFLAADKDELQHTINRFKVRNYTTVSSIYDLEHAEFDITKLRDRDRKEEAQNEKSNV